jgi:hypothetical protein
MTFRLDDVRVGFAKGRAYIRKHSEREGRWVRVRHAIGQGLARFVPGESGMSGWQMPVNGKRRKSLFGYQCVLNGAVSGSPMKSP